MSELIPVDKKPTKFQKGQSGNPAGRPKGSKNAISLVKIQVEGELRGRMRGRMGDVVEEMFRQALPREVPLKDKSGAAIVDPTTGKVATELLDGDSDMLKTLFKAWVSGTKTSDEDAPKEKIQIVIGKLDQIPAVNGRVFPQSSTTEE